MISLACLALAGSLVCWWPADPSHRVSAWLNRSGRSAVTRSWTGWVRGLTIAAALAVCASLAPRLLVWVIPGLVVLATAGWLVVNARAEKARHHNGDEVVQACLAVATQLRVGDIPSAALARVAGDSPLLQPVAATHAIGGDVPAALRVAAGRPGCAGLAALGRSWQLCQITGAPIADAAARVAEGLRAEAAAERLVSSELASPRASGRMLALLPLMGIGLGFTGGGDPLAFLAGTQGGRICLAAAICLVCAGLVWTTLLGRLRGEDVEGT
ncbi:pilus assembly protein TadB [Brooklawnia sp.]|uniref:type II secretion system F family protein n=1 Tax=Brooklawnia sp. TaxID=2699740 RepID=UPI00311F3CAB